MCYVSHDRGVNHSFIEYDKQNYFDSFGQSWMCLINSVNIENLLKLHRNLINNITKADTLRESIIEESAFTTDWTCGLHSYSSEEIEDFSDIQSGKAFLRVNKEKKAVYTVKRSKDWYIFKAFTTHIYAGNKKDIRFDLLSKWCIKSIPDILSFEVVRSGVPLECITTIDPDLRFYEEGNNGYSTHVFADRNGSIAFIHYTKNEDGKFYVKSINWNREGRNILPYLLPIDRQLIDPNYIPPEEIENSEEENNSCCIIM